MRGPCLASVACESQASAEFLLCPQVTAQGGWNPSGKSDETLGWFIGTCPGLNCLTVAVISKPQINHRHSRESSSSSCPSLAQICGVAQ